MQTPIEIPKIEPVVEDGRPRPFWSVMIPTYNPPADYLEQTLRSVLQQAPGPEEMQIEVVDDCSPNGAPVEIVQRVGAGRIVLHREAANNGLSRIWNRCIARARGRWVHILHQDDIVEPGFYEALRRGAMDERCGAAFSRFAFMNEKGHWYYLSDIERDSPGILENWHEKITLSCCLQCAAIVVRRATYEDLGGFLPNFPHALDWEMWQRIAAQRAIWFEPTILAAFRIHSRSTTSRQELEGLDAIDRRAVIEFTKAYHPPERGAVLVRRAQKNSANFGMAQARRLLLLNHPRAAWHQVGLALRTSLGWPVLPKLVLLVFLQIKLLVFPPKSR